MPVHIYTDYKTGEGDAMIEGRGKLRLYAIGLDYTHYTFTWYWYSRQ